MNVVKCLSCGNACSVLVIEFCGACLGQVTEGAERVQSTVDGFGLLLGPGELAAHVPEVFA